MRLALAATLFGLLAPFGVACFDGKDALGLPCEQDFQCGRGQSCEANVCGGPQVADTQTADTQTDTGSLGPCEPPPPPTWCGEGTPVTNREIFVDEFERPELGRASSIVAGDFTSDARTDLAVLSFDTFHLHMVSNEVDGFVLSGTLAGTDLTSAYDVIATDRDCDGSIEFVVVANDGHVIVANWDRTAEEFSVVGHVDLGPGTFSLAAADILEDENDYPDLIVSSSERVSVVRNSTGVFDQQSIAQIGMGLEFYEPWDTLIVGTGAGARIVVPASDDLSIDGQRDQIVHLLRVTETGGNAMLVRATPPYLADDFRNPWAVAQGDFDGNGELEIAVAERNLNGENESTNEPGRLRFFRLAQAFVTEIVTPGIVIGVGPGVLEAADLDCDGRDDLVIGNGGSPETLGTPQVLYGVGDLATASAVDIPLSGVSPGSRMAVGNFDDDGRPEVAIPDYGDPVGVPGARVVIVGVDEAQ